MNNIQKRFILFLFGCIFIRSIFVYIVKNTNGIYLQLFGIVALFISLGFITIYLFNLRTSGQETFGDKIWWNNLRPIHTILYLLFAYMAFNKNKNSYIPLLIDVCIGLLSFLYYHYSSGNIKLLLS
jgi:hypothetical protein